MKKLFISQPMNGKSDEEILSIRKSIIEHVEGIVGEKVEILESFFEDFKVAEGKNVPLMYLSKSLELLAQADIAYFGEGWQNARGCMIEYKCAVKYGIDKILTDGNVVDCDFGTALEFCKKGARISRKGWNGKGLFVVYQKGYPDGIPCNKATADAWGIPEGSLFKCNPYLQINTVDDSHAMWVPSINDVLANDWNVVG